jgi:hypothetical protein
MRFFNGSAILCMEWLLSKTRHHWTTVMLEKQTKLKQCSKYASYGFDVVRVCINTIPIKAGVGEFDIVYVRNDA